MTEMGRELVEQAHQQALGQLLSEPRRELTERQEVAQPNFPPAMTGSPFAEEWEVFRREVGRLLAAGCRGRFALIKSGQTITVWDTLHDAAQAGQLLYGSASCLIQQILPHLRSLRAG